MLPSGTTLAKWYKENEPLLQEDPTNQSLVRIVAVALLPICEADPRTVESGHAGA